MTKKIIILVESPFNTRDYNRFGIEILKANGLDVEVWDLTKVFHPKLILTVRDPFLPPCLILFKNKKEALDSIKRLDFQCMIITWFEYSYSRFFWLYRAMSKSNAVYSVMMVNAPATFYGITEGLRSKLKRIFARAPLKVRLRMVLDKLFSSIPFKYLGIKPAVFWFAGTDVSLKTYNYPADSATKNVFLHAFDYNLYLEKNNKEAGLSGNAVFLDSYLPFHEDDEMVGVGHWVTAQNYYPNLCRFFDYIEKEQNIRVDIAAHPRSFYEKHQDYFGKRKLSVGRTIEYVKGVKFVIAHESNAINFAVIYRKPVIFIITDEMVRNNVAQMVYNIAFNLGKTPINIDRPFVIGWDKELAVDAQKYDIFMDRFIKKKGTPEINSWQIVANTLKGAR